MPSLPSLTVRVSRLARKKGALRTRDFEAAGINRVALTRLVEQGILQRLGRGLYGLHDAKVTEHHTLVEAALRVPAGVVCLLSALQFHKLSTQSPREVRPKQLDDRFGDRLVVEQIELGLVVGQYHLLAPGIG